MNDKNFHKQFIDKVKEVTDIDKNYTFIDIGANTGLLTKALLNSSKNINSCYLIEPDKDNFFCLQHNLHKQENIHAFNFALDIKKRKELFPFSLLAKHRVNTLIFPNLSSGNIAYKFIQEMSDIETIGPVLLGMKKPVHVLQLGSSVREIVNMVTLAVVDAQMKGRTTEKLSDIDEKMNNLI